MIPNPQLMTAVEQLGYRVTCGDVATQTGIQLEEVRSALLALANQTGGHLQVTTTGEIIYDLAPDFRQILHRKYLRLQFQAGVSKIWTVLFYLIKISFGILLIVSISVVYLSILAITLAAIFSEGGGDCGDCGGSCVLDIGNSGGNNRSSNPTTTADRNSEPFQFRSSPPIREKTHRQPLNFLAAVFSVLFGDGNPNADLEQRRWNYIGNLIHRQHGVAIGEQIAPYLDDLGWEFDWESENYMLPVLTKFNGIPEVSPTGKLVYHFPDLQTTLKDEPTQFTRVPQCLRERKWKFSKATSTQTGWAIALCGANLVGIAVLVMMLSGTVSGWVSSVITVLALYGIGLVVIPACRYFWIKRQNERVKYRNQSRHQQVKILHQSASIQAKLDFARQFAKQHQVTDRDIIYTTAEDALDQDFQRLEDS